MTRRGLLGLATLPAALLAVLLLPAAPASAHPLGNFSVNQYLGLTLRPDRVDAVVAVDLAEIPTLQERPRVDADGDGATADPERSAYAARTCQDLAGAVDARVSGQRLQWTVTASELGYSPGSGGLDVSRLGCRLSAPASLGEAAQFTVDNSYLADRVGWREMTATGAGVHLVGSTLPATSVSDELRDYPKDLLSSTLDVRSATVRVAPGAGADQVATSGDGDGSDSGVGVAALAGAGDDPVSRWMATVDRHFQDLAGGPTLTPLVGLLAVGLALLLGAGHAVLPGHGKTVLAAYLAGRRGRPRDALVVAGTVTLTHTGGVIALGLLLAAGTTLAGEKILGWLGLVSGTVVLLVGLGMAASVLRRRRAALSHDRHHHHDGDHHHHHDPDPDPDPGPDHGPDHDHHHDHHHHHGRSGRWGLAGIGLAGGLVPSPSALVVLLAAIGLGRTGFGILLVLAYGVGMATTLTAAGLALVALQHRLTRPLWSWLAVVSTRIAAATPAATAALVLFVGAGLAARAAAGVF